MRPFDLLHIESYRRDLVFLVEIEEFVGVEQRFRRQDRDDVERHSVLPQQADAAQHPVEGALALPGTALPVVEESRAVYADTWTDAVLDEEPAPGVVNQGSVGLEGVMDLDRRT